MTTRLSSKGQVVLPKQVRLQLRLRAGMKFSCKVQGHSIVLTPEQPLPGTPRLIKEPRSGLQITKSPPETKVSNDDVRTALLDLP